MADNSSNCCMYLPVMTFPACYIMLLLLLHKIQHAFGSFRAHETNCIVHCRSLLTSLQTSLSSALFTALVQNK